MYSSSGITFQRFDSVAVRMLRYGWQHLPCIGGGAIREMRNVWKSQDLLKGVIQDYANFVVHADKHLRKINVSRLGFYELSKPALARS